MEDLELVTDNAGHVLNITNFVSYDTNKMVKQNNSILVKESGVYEFNFYVRWMDNAPDRENPTPISAGIGIAINEIWKDEIWQFAWTNLVKRTTQSNKFRISLEEGQLIKLSYMIGAIPDYLPEGKEILALRCIIDYDGIDIS